MSEKSLAQHLRQQGLGRSKRHAIAATFSTIPKSGRAEQSSAEPPSAQSHRERDDDYHRVVYVSDGWRVIVCKDGIQWIVQSRRRSARRQVEWKGRSYCTTLTALLRDWRRHTGDDGAILAKTLPEPIWGQT